MNNQKTLKKILEELQKDKPRIDYVVGMLEVLIDEPVVTPLAPYVPSVGLPIDEASLLDSMAKSSMEKMITIEKL